MPEFFPDPEAYPDPDRFRLPIRDMAQKRRARRRALRSVLVVVLILCSAGGLSAVLIASGQGLAHHKKSETATSTTSTPPTTSESSTTSTSTSTTTTTTLATTSTTAVAQCARGDGTLIVCPGVAAVGMTVVISSDTTCGAVPGAEPLLVFLGPTDYIGSGGSGVEIKITPKGHGFVATFVIPRTYPGGSPGTTPPTILPVKAGSNYAFATYPADADECYVHFTVDAS